MTHTRARERSLISVMSASVLLAGALVGCDSTESQRAAFEDQGYSNVQNLKNEGRPNSYRATLDSCTIELLLTPEKDLLTVVIVETADGSMVTIAHAPGEAIFTPINSADELKANQRFQRYCS